MSEAIAPGRGRFIAAWVDRFLDWGIALFAAWTVAYHAAITFGWSRTTAIALTVPITAGLVLARLPDRPSDMTRRGKGASPWVSVGVPLIAILAATRSPLFWPAALVFGVALLTRLPQWSAVDHRGDGLWGPIGVIVLAVLSGLLSASVVRWTFDDTYYVDRALEVAESSGPMPYGVDTIHSDGAFPSAEPDNDLASWHPLAGVAADATGQTPRGFISLVAQPLVAGAAVLAIWRVLGLLGASRPALATALVVVLALLLANGVRGVWYQMWSSHSGRGMLATLLVPLALAYGVVAGRSPSWRSAARVAAICVAGAGSTVSAAMVIPPLVVAGVAAAAPGWRASGMGSVWVGVGVGTGYLAVVATIGLDAVSGLAVAGGAVNTVAAQWVHGGVGVNQPPLVVAVVTGLCLLALVVGSAGGRRAAVLLAVLVFGFVVAPLLLVYTGKGAPTVYRGAWALAPMVLVGLALDGLLERLAGRLAVALALVVVLIWGRGLPLDRVGMPRADLPRPARVEAARDLARAAPPGSVVAAPWRIAGPIPPLTSRVYPVAVQGQFVRSIGAADPSFRAEDRRAIVAAVTTGDFERDRLTRLLDDFEVRAMCVATRAHRKVDLRSTLRDAGFRRAGSTGPCIYWSR